MESSPSTNGGLETFTSLPTELILQVASSLPNLKDVLSLSATHKRLRAAIQENTNTIVVGVGVPAWKEARQLLADQGGPHVDAHIVGLSEIRAILLNQQAINRAITAFETHVVQRLQLTRVDCPKVYGMAIHPPRLTPSERIRFTRAWYEVRSFMTIPEAEWDLRLEHITRLEQLEVLREICRVNGLHPSYMRDEMLSMLVPGPLSDAARKTRNLGLAITKRAQCVYYSHFGSGVVVGQSCSLSEEGIGSNGFWKVWDHSQQCCLKKQVTQPRLSPYTLDAERHEPMEELWDEATDDELQGC